MPYVSIAGKWRFRERDIELWLDRAGPMPNLLLMQGGKATETASAEAIARREPVLADRSGQMPGHEMLFPLVV